MARKSRRGILVLVIVAAVAIGGLGFLLTAAPPTPIFSTGNPANDGGAGAAHTYTYPTWASFSYESFLPSDPNTDSNISTIQVWMERGNSSNGAGYIGVFLQGGGINEATCQNTDSIPDNGCYAVFPGTIISPIKTPVLVTFDVSGLNWVRHASTTLTDIYIEDVGANGDIGLTPPQGGYNIALLWASASSQGSGHHASHAGSAYVLNVPPSFHYYDIAMSVFATLTAPPAPLTADFTSSSSGLTVTFASTVAGGNPPYKYQWIFGDSSQSTSASPTHVYSKSGSYVVNLSVGDSGFHIVYAQHIVTVSSTYTPMSVDFTFTVDADGVTARFTSSVSHGLSPYTYSWAFGDGGTSTTQNPVHAYASTGSFTVTLSVTDTKPATVTATHTVQTNAQTPPPTASFSFTAKYLYVTFVGSASGGTSPYSYSWNFGDGYKSTVSSTSHGYLAAGSYDVTFTVTDSKNLVGSQTRTVSVSAPPPEPTPLTSVDFTDQNIGNSTVSFTSTVKGGNGTLTYSWDFGDGGASASGNPSYQYANTGTFTVTLKVTDSSGTSMTAKHDVAVTAAPGAPLPWVQILGIVLAGVGATFAALMLEYRKLRKIHYVFGVVLLIALGAVLIAGVL